MTNYLDYNSEGTLLRKHQLRMLEMLIYLDAVCKENNIDYWLSSGTLLGAVRHKGFIPWDDDLDVEMLTHDFNKLEKVLSQEAQYELQTHKTDLYYMLTFNKLRDRNSKVIYNQRENEKLLFRGVFIDIFCIEPSHWCVAWFFTHVYHKIEPLSYRLEGKFGYLLFRVIRAFYFFMLQTARFFFRWIPGKKYRHALGSICYDKVRSIEDIFPLRNIVFEGHLFPAPNNLDVYLTEMYGNYMEIPKQEDIQTHLSEIELY